MKFLKNLLNGAGGKADDPAATAPVPAQTATVGEDFAELDLPEELNRAIADLGFTRCTPVQKQVLPHSLDGRDIIAQAQTGTGKTAAFLISIIAYDLENPSLQSPQTLELLR